MKSRSTCGQFPFRRPACLPPLAGLVRETFTFQQIPPIPLGRWLLAKGEVGGAVTLVSCPRYPMPDAGRYWSGCCFAKLNGRPVHVLPSPGGRRKAGQNRRLLLEGEKGFPGQSSSTRENRSTNLRGEKGMVRTSEAGKQSGMPSKTDDDIVNEALGCQHQVDRQKRRGSGPGRFHRREERRSH